MEPWDYPNAIRVLSCVLGAMTMIANSSLFIIKSTSISNVASRGGDVDPHILVKWVKQDVPEGSDPIASMIIFEWKDYDLIGVQVR